ncbi:MAG: flagellar protein FliS [Defluviitaleaceae bacterium]|nr:flagellar protein FliS [Defluviitaleaceae bacterium]
MYDISKIISSTPLELLIMTYNLLFEELNKIIEHTKNKDKNITENIEYCQKIVHSLISSLNLEYKETKDIYDLYLYINHILSKCLAKSNRTNQENIILQDIKGVKEILAVLFDSICKLPDIDSPLHNASYVGNYNRDGSISEIYGTNESKDYKA